MHTHFMWLSAFTVNFTDVLVYHVISDSILLWVSREEDVHVSFNLDKVQVLGHVS